jgi:hypothetical protein
MFACRLSASNACHECNPKQVLAALVQGRRINKTSLFKTTTAEPRHTVSTC